jgi:hypothetical protein
MDPMAVVLVPVWEAFQVLASNATPVQRTHTAMVVLQFIKATTTVKMDPLTVQLVPVDPRAPTPRGHVPVMPVTVNQESEQLLHARHVTQGHLAHQEPQAAVSAQQALTRALQVSK